MTEEHTKDDRKNLLGGLITALRTFTVFPVPGQDAKSMAGSLPWFPIVGVILGGLVYAVTAAFQRFTHSDWPEAAAFIAVAAGVFVTRGFHLDGLSDWADSFGALNNRKRMLEIMKDSRVGVFGVLALITILMGKWIAVTRLCSDNGILWIMAAYIISRTSQVEMITTLPYARPEGGTASAFVSGARPIHRWIAHLLAILLLFVLFGWQGLIFLIIGGIVGIVFGIWCRRRFGGVTGDLVGACSEIVETTVLFATALSDAVGIS